MKFLWWYTDFIDAGRTAAKELLLRIALEMNGGAPAGDDWHTKPLSQMAKAVPKLRSAVIGRETRGLLDELRRFRHRIRQAYDEELDWAKMEPLLATVTSAHTSLIHDLEEFTHFLTQLVEGLL